MKGPEEEDPSINNNTNFPKKIGLLSMEGPLSPGSSFENYPQRNPPVGRWFQR